MTIGRRTQVGKRWISLNAAALALGALVAACGGSPPEVKDPDPDSKLLQDDGKSGASSDSGGLSGVRSAIEQGKFEDAKGQIEKLLQSKPNEPETLYYLGVVNERLGDAAGAEAAYKKALSADPNFAEAAENLAALYLEGDAPRADDAIGLLKNALSKTPKNPRLMQNLAYAHSIKKDYDKASEQYDAAIANGGDSAQLRFAYGAMLVEADRQDKAVEQLKKALAGTDKDVETLGALGRMLGMAGAKGDCVKAFDKAIALKSDMPELYLRRGTCRQDLKDATGARTDFEAASKIDPKFAAAYYYWGLSFLVEKKNAEAKPLLEKAVALGGDTPVGKLARQKLGEIPKK